MWEAEIGTIIVEASHSKWFTRLDLENTQHKTGLAE
jgi:hypothetical protein